MGVERNQVYGPLPGYQWPSLPLVATDVGRVGSKWLHYEFVGHSPKGEASDWWNRQAGASSHWS